MTYLFRFLILVFFGIQIVSCASEIKKESDLNNNTHPDFNQENVLSIEIFPKMDSLDTKIKVIEENFLQINSIRDWSNIVTKDLWSSTQGGKVKFYVLNGEVQKIVVQQFGETFQVLNEYFLLNDKLSIVSEKLYTYNRPIEYDSTSMIENHDTEVFDYKKSLIVEDKYYFENWQVIQRFSNKFSDSTFTKEMSIIEQKRIISDYNTIIELIKEE